MRTYHRQSETVLATARNPIYTPGYVGLMERQTRRLLVGRQPVLTRRYHLGGVGVFVVWAGYLISDMILILPLWVLALFFVGLPELQVYQNGGLLVSIVLGLCMALGVFLPLIVFNLAAPSEDPLWGLGASLIYGVPAGGLGFGMGAGANRLRAHLQ